MRCPLRYWRHWVDVGNRRLFTNKHAIALRYVGPAMSLELFLETLSDETGSIPVTEFAELSDLSPAELGVFARIWFGIEHDRKQRIVTAMVESAEENTELDFSAIFKMCLKDKDEFILEKAIEGLWEQEDRSIIPSLVQVLQSGQSPRVRAAAAVALGKFPVLVQEGKLLARDRDTLHDSLMEILENPDQPLEVRRRSLEAIAPLNTIKIQELVTWAYDSDDIDLKSSSIYAMGRTGELSWLPVLLRELESREPSIRYESAHACGELGEEDAIPHLIPLLQDDDYQVQLASVNALGKIGGSMAKKVLVNCIREGDAVLEDAAKAELENLEFLEDPMAFTSES